MLALERQGPCRGVSTRRAPLLPFQRAGTGPNSATDKGGRYVGIPLASALGL